MAEHVRLHHGRVWVEDRPDGHAGARFVVELPALDDEHATEGDGTYLGDDYGLDEVVVPPVGSPAVEDPDDAGSGTAGAHPQAIDSVASDGTPPGTAAPSAPERQAAISDGGPTP